MKMHIPEEVTRYRFPILLRLLDQLQAAKGEHYGSSWCKRGLVVSVYGNLARKWDRVEQVFSHMGAADAAPPDTGAETLAKTLIDLGVYCVLSTMLLGITAPNSVKKAFEDDGIEYPTELLKQPEDVVIDPLS